MFRDSTPGQYALTYIVGAPLLVALTYVLRYFTLVCIAHTKLSTFIHYPVPPRRRSTDLSPSAPPPVRSKRRPPNIAAATSRAWISPPAPLRRWRRLLPIIARVAFLNGLLTNLLPSFLERDVAVVGRRIRTCSLREPPMYAPM